MQLLAFETHQRCIIIAVFRWTLYFHRGAIFHWSGWFSFDYRYFDGFFFVYIISLFFLMVTGVVFVSIRSVLIRGMLAAAMML